MSLWIRKQEQEMMSILEKLTHRHSIVPWKTASWLTWNLVLVTTKWSIVNARP